MARFRARAAAFRDAPGLIALIAAGGLLEQVFTAGALWVALSGTGTGVALLAIVALIPLPQAGSVVPVATGSGWQARSIHLAPTRDVASLRRRPLEHLHVLMVVVMGCPECGRGYSITDFRGERDRNGARPFQCPHCYALVGHTSQDASKSAWEPAGPGE